MLIVLMTCFYKSFVLKRENRCGLAVYVKILVDKKIIVECKMHIFICGLCACIQIYARAIHAQTHTEDFAKHKIEVIVLETKHKRHAGDT